MAEPSRSDPVECLSNVIRVIPSFVGHQDGLSLYPPFVQLLQTRLDQPSSKSERTLNTTLPDRAKLQCKARHAHRHDQDVWPCHAHDDEAIEVYGLAGNAPGLAKNVVERVETNITYSILTCLPRRPFLIAA
jgi:hypothetical protein